MTFFIKKIIGAFLLLSISILALAQKTEIKTEYNSFREVNGVIAITLIINGHRGDFVLDLAGETTITQEFAKTLGVSDISANEKFKLSSVAFGNNAFLSVMDATLVKDKEVGFLNENRLAGTIDGSLFKNVVLTIDKRGKRILTSVPYKPSFMKLTERIDCNIEKGMKISFEVEVNEKPLNVLFDTRQAVTFKTSSNASSTEANKTSASLNNALVNTSLSLINVKIEDVNGGSSGRNQHNNFINNFDRPVVGLGLLDYGVISIDYVRSKIYFQSYENTVIEEMSASNLSQIVPGKLNAITRDEFLAYIFDYKKNKEFVFKGDKPVVIDFWASWCAPCKKLLPVMEQLAEKYKDRVVFYKVNTDLEKELSSILNIVALPTLFFIPVGGQPIIDVGAQPEKYISIIEEKLLQE